MNRTTRHDDSAKDKDLPAANKKTKDNQSSEQQSVSGKRPVDCHTCEKQYERVQGTLTRPSETRAQWQH